MSVSDESGGKPKRILRPLSEDEWRRARIQFETGDREMTQERISFIFKTSLSSVQKRSAKEKWSKGAELVAEARNQLQIATTSALTKAAEKAAEQVTGKLMQELAPWIEKEKRAQIQRAVKRSKRAQKRLDSLADGYEVFDPKSGAIVKLPVVPKDEMHFATAEDKYDGIIRRNLGMNDGASVGGSLNLNILTNQAAVQVVAHPG